MSTTKSDRPTKTTHRVPFESLGMQAGMTLQTRPQDGPSNTTDSQFFAAVVNKGVIIGPSDTQSPKTELKEDDLCVVSGFTGLYEFSFVGKVLQTFVQPLAYVVLNYPEEVDARQVRKAVRTKTSWPTDIQPTSAAAEESAAPIAVKLLDLSVQGAMIEGPAGLGEAGSMLAIHLRVRVDGQPGDFRTNARICHNTKSTKSDAHHVGLVFPELSDADKLMLHYLTNNPKSN